MMAMRAWMPVVAVTAGLWAASAQSQPERPSPSERFEQAWTWCMEGTQSHFIADGCSVLVVSGRLSDADLAVAYFKRGMALMSLLDDERVGLSDISRAIRLNPSYEKAYVVRGIMGLTRGHYDRAIADFDEVLRLNPSDTYIAGQRASAIQRKAAAGK